MAVIMQNTAKKENKTFSDQMRVVFKGILDPIAGFLNKLGIHPNTITLLGAVGHLAGAVLIGFGQITWGGIVILLFSPLDVVDGAMARLKGEATRFGAFLDSVMDRYEELSIFGGLLVYFIIQQNILGVILSYLAAAGSLLVSYTRSKAEGVGYEAKIGLLSRLERYIILIPALIFNFPIIALIILAALTNFTAFQRIWHVWKQSKQS